MAQRSPPKVPGSGDEAPLPKPRLESTYSRIIVGAIGAAKERSGLTRKVRAVTRELAALLPHTRERFSSLTIFGKALAVVCLLGAGGVFTYLGMRMFGAPNPDGLRQEVQAKIVEQDFVAANVLIGELQRTPEGLNDNDRWQLLAPTQAGLDRMRRSLMSEVEEHRRAQRFDAALERLAQLEAAGLAPEWTLFTHAELLRSAGRPGDAVTFYQRYSDLYGNTEHADDALFWQAAIARDGGDALQTRRLLSALLDRYPGTNFRSSARRWLLELDAPKP